MTVIAWDGKSLAADRQINSSNVKYEFTKLHVCPDPRTGLITATAWAGMVESGLTMREWFFAGADPAKWPEIQKNDEDYAHFIVARPAAGGVECFWYGKLPVAMQVESAPFAWGSGRDFALSAMVFGQSARDAVLFTGRFDRGCGGVDSFTFP